MNEFLHEEYQHECNTTSENALSAKTLDLELETQREPTFIVTFFLLEKNNH